MNTFLHRMLGHHPMNEEGGGSAAPAPAAAPAASAPAPAATGAAPAADAGNKQARPDTLLTATQADPAAAGAAGADGQAKDGAPATEEGAEPTGAPESYTDFTMAEGLSLDPEVHTEFTKAAKELNLSQKQAQGLIDLQNKMESGREAAQQAQFEELLTEQRTRWAQELQKDPEFGGDNFQKNVTTAIKAMEAFGNEEVRVLLNESGIGNNPAVVKMFHKIGLAITEDRFVLPGATSKTTDETRAADVMFPGV